MSALVEHDESTGVTESGPTWARQLNEESFSFTQAVGGWRGLTESVLPALLFVVVFIIFHSVVGASVVAGVVALLAVGIRLVQRQPLTQSLSGVIGVGIGVVWALASGRGENFYTWGLITSAAFLVGFLASIVVRKPLISRGAGMFWELEAGWYRKEEWAGLNRRGLLLTWLWTGLFALRLGIELPLWLAHMVGPLGIAKLVLGLPLFALVTWLTWMGLKPFSPTKADEHPAQAS